MAAGERVFLREQDSEVMVEVDPPTGSALQEPPKTIKSEPDILNQGNIEATGGRITLAAGDIYSQAISNIGSVSASVTADQAGWIDMSANAGQISNTGSIAAKSDSGRGGSVTVKADEIINAGTVDVTGKEGENGVFVPSIEASTVSDGAIEAWLNNGTSVEITTANDSIEGDGIFLDGDGPDRGSIFQDENARIDKTSGANATITMTADHDVDLRGGIVSESGKLDVVLKAQGDVSLGAEIATNGGDFSSSGVQFDNLGGPIHADGGDVTISQTGDIRTGNISGRTVNITSDVSLMVEEGEISPTDNLRLHAGSSGKGDLSFEPGTVLAPADVALHAGDGLDPDVLDTYWDNSGLEPSCSDWPGGGGTDARVGFANF